MRSKKNNKKMILIVVVVIVVIIGTIICVSLVNKGDKNNNTNLENKEKVKEEKKDEPKKISIVDTESDSRNIAVMINNINVVWGYQSGLQDAYILYEMIVEGGITRLLGIYRDSDVTRIGTVRSSRPYYLDYVLENDAIYVHFGGSDQALSDIKTLGINNINGMTYGSAFMRDTSLGLSSEHTAFTSMDRIESAIKYYGYRSTSDKDLLLSYSVDEVDLSKMEGAIPANSVYIGYSNSRSTGFEYDSDSKVYKRYQNNTPHKDYATGIQYTAKNIITYKVKNYSLDSYGRQALDNIGSGEGYYISDGYAVPISWTKDSRGSKTIYKYKNGQVINVNDGNTHIEIQPMGQTLSIE